MGERRTAMFLAAFVLASVFMVSAFAIRAARTDDRFDFLLWEIRSLPNRWLYRLGEPLRGDTSYEEAIAQYFSVADKSSSEARRLENAAEAAIEARIASVLGDAGVGWPLSGAVPGVLPPVDFELAASPRVLVVSPRERIARERTESLRPDLGLAEVEALERDAEADGERSALVVETGGIAAYPAIVERERYESIVGTAAHEWVHHYLALYPLGRAYFDSSDTRAINETVADIAGDEIARLVIERYGVPPQAAMAGPPPGGSSSSTDVNRVLRELRVEVEALLAAGRIADAEQRMEAVRRELGAAGVPIRRLNQAYFAWYGTYTSRPDSVDPLGSQVRAARARSGSLARFLEQLREVQTRAEVERLAGVP